MGCFQIDASRLGTVRTEVIRVFLVDDHALIRLAMRRVLEADEHFIVVGEASNAEESLIRLETIAADMVVMEIQLPGMNGVEATRLLKARHRDLKVVIVSAFGEEYLVPSIEAGADGFMSKGLISEMVVEGLLRAAEGIPPIDPSLTRHLMDQAVSERVGDPLSERQREMLKLVAQGLSSKEIALQLFISGTTLKREFRKVFDQLGANDRSHAIAEAYRRGLI